MTRALHPENPPRLRVVLTKLTPDRHRLTVVPASGPREELELETRSYLEHVSGPNDATTP